uniref:transcription factor SPT20 homolog isoform X2 n=1 Tax=Myxine glutinosa TaxID=7769 RepID=UPI00359024BE
MVSRTGTALEQALDHAEYIIESASQKPPRRKMPTTSGSRWKSLYQKMYDIFVEESSKEPEMKRLRKNVKLLEKVVNRDRPCCLIINFFKGNEGYSLMLRAKNGSDVETLHLPYEEGEFLAYLDSGELPPVLVDLLEKAQVNIFHSGCVIAEIRDYRQVGLVKGQAPDVRHVLLKPTAQTLICDVNAITCDNHKWTQEDKLALESHMLLATSEPLCLDPSVSISCVANRLLHQRMHLNSPRIQRAVQRRSWPALVRQLESIQPTTPACQRLHTYLSRRKDKRTTMPRVDLKISRTSTCVDTWKQRSLQLSVPSEIDVEKYLKVEQHEETHVSENLLLQDEFVFEHGVSDRRSVSRLMVHRVPGDSRCYGTSFVSKSVPDGDEGELMEGAKFILADKQTADRLVRQLKEVVENEVRQAVQVIHHTSASGPPGLSSPLEDPEAMDTGVSVPCSVLGKGIRHRPPPIKLPGPAPSCSSSTTGFSPTGSLIKSSTPPPMSQPGRPASRKHSMDTATQGMLSPPAMSPAALQRAGTPKSSTPTPTNTPSSTPHPSDARTPTPTAPLTHTPSPQDVSTGGTACPPLAAHTPQPLSTLVGHLGQPVATAFASGQGGGMMPLMTIPFPGSGQGTANNPSCGSSSPQVVSTLGHYLVCGAQPLLTSAIVASSSKSLGLIGPTGLIHATQAGGASPMAFGSLVPGSNSNAQALRSGLSSPLSLLPHMPGCPGIRMHSPNLVPPSPFGHKPGSLLHQSCEVSVSGPDGSLTTQQATVISLPSIMPTPQQASSRAGQRMQLSPVLQQQPTSAVAQHQFQQMLQQQMALATIRQQQAVAAAALAGPVPSGGNPAGQHKAKKKRTTPATPPQT